MKVLHYLISSILVSLLLVYAAQAEEVTVQPPAIIAVKDRYTLSVLTPSSFSTLTTDQQKNIAEQWHLTIDDYTRYLWLMSNTPNAFYYKDKNLDPSWILGFNAKDEQERQKYVVIAIQNERERIAKELAFQRDFTQLQQQLFPNQKPILIINKK